MQRLFSTFANGWPGLGLLVLRLAIARPLIASAAFAIYPAAVAPAAPAVIGGVAGLFLLAGLWTPLAGATIAFTQIWSIFSGTGDRWDSILLASVAASLSLLGPGAWSLDATLFGRKRVVTTDL